MEKYISINEVATLFGVTNMTIRRWDKSKKLLPCFRTFGNHRRYSLQKILEILSPSKKK